MEDSSAVEDDTVEVEPLDPISEAIDAFGIAATSLQGFYQERLDNIRIREAERTEEFEGKINTLIIDEKNLQDDLDARNAEIQQQLDALQQERDSLMGTHNFTKQKVKLDIGGTRFTTSRTTLLADKSSFLAAMLSGRYELFPDAADGSYFIDRDGRQFHHVLNFLRGVDSFECPSKMSELEQLRADAVFYKLSQLVTLVDQAISRSRR